MSLHLKRPARTVLALAAALVIAIPASPNSACGQSSVVKAQGPGEPTPSKVTADISVLHWPGCPSYPCKAKRDGKMPGMRSDAIIVKFNADAKVRLRDAKESVGGLVDLGTGQIKDAAVQAMLAKYAALGCTWSKMHHTLSEDRLDEMRTKAMRTLGKMITDMNAEFFLSIPAGLDTIAVIDDFNSLSIVEMAEQAPEPAPLPAAGDYRNNQGYLKVATEGGINAYGVRLLAGGDGSAVSIADCEYSWNDLHTDLPLVIPLVANASDPFADNNHGTAVLGEMSSRNDNIGTQGGAYGAHFYFAAVNTSSGGYNLANAVTASAAIVGAGGVVVIEQQIPGPNWTGVPTDPDFGLVPSEWVQSVYNAIVAAIGNGVHVVAAAGNGSQNLDAPEYSTGHGGFYPFLATNDSGDIIVGAGSPPGGSSTDRSRLSFSCYGSTVDLQGHGENVYTTGYGDLYNASVNELYTAVFSGTSSATPIVSSAVALYSSIYKTRFGFPPSPSNTRSNLILRGSAQQSGVNPATEKIGPRPDVLATWNSILAYPFPALTPNDDCGSAQDVSSQGTFIGYLCGARSDGTGSCDSAGANVDVWYRYTAPANRGGMLVVTTSGTRDYGYTDQGMDTVLTLLSGCGGTELACNNDSSGMSDCTTSGSTRDSSVSTTLAPGQTVLIRVSPAGSSPPGPFKLSVRMPLRVTSPVAGEVINTVEWAVRWDVNGTDLPPVNCQSVAIDVSVDGGLTFPLVAVADTPNTGEASFRMPLLTTNARVRVRALDNSFCALNPGPFRVQPTWGTTATATGAGSTVSNAGAAASTASAGGVTASAALGVLRANGSAAISSGTSSGGGNVTASFVDYLVFAAPGSRPGSLGHFTSQYSVSGSASALSSGDQPGLDPDVIFSYAAAGVRQQITIESTTDFRECGAGVTRYGNDPPDNDFCNFSTTLLLDVPIVWGKAVVLAANLDGGATVSSSPLTTAASNFESSHTGRWMGILAVFDEAGNPVTDYTVVSASGKDYRIPAFDCPVDMDQSFSLGVNDIFVFLNLWFAGDARADFDTSGGLAIADIFAYLNAWFAGCP